MERPLYCLAYTSRITNKAATEQTILEAIYHKSQLNNIAMHITGFLVYKQGKFFQYIEGNEAAINTLYQTLLQDDRHHNLVQLLSGRRENRQFSEWVMCCFDLDQHTDWQQISRYLNTFATYEWQEAQTEQVIFDVQQFYQHYALQQTSQMIIPHQMQHRLRLRKMLLKATRLSDLMLIVMLVILLAWWIIWGVQALNIDY